MNCPFKQYRDIIGVPGTGIHSYRFENTAIIDYFVTILLAMLLTKVTKIPLVLTTILLLVLGIILHMLFGVETSVLKYLGISCNNIKGIHIV